MKFNIPKEVKDIILQLSGAGFEAYPVGGCVRDVMLGISPDKGPKDWDITTNAKPEEIQKLFEDSVYENNFGTVAVKTESEDERLKIVEITTFRVESNYSDKRHPDEIRFSKRLEDDLGRRDFTINATALEINNSDYELIDLYGGQKDLKKKIIKTVGNPEKRFGEDALRLLRAVRLATELGFKIEKETREAIEKKANLLTNVAEERIRDEFIRIIMADKADEGVRLLEELNLLEHIIPELREGIGCDQAKHHIYTVWEHSIRSLKYAAENNYSLKIRLAALLHDVGKPRTKEGKGEKATFYNHEMVGANMAKKIMKRLKFPKDLSEAVVHLVRYHLFYYNVGEVTEAGVRRFLRRVGSEYIDDLMRLREADRVGSGVPKAVPYKNRHLLFMIDKVKRDPISTKMLKISGDEVMAITGISPGPKVGWVLNALMEEILDEPDKNSKDYLEKRAKELVKLSDEELESKAKAGEKEQEEFEKGIIRELKEKHKVK
jgi:tRNA nucleotidyltransferase (CCA-adding enzyme)